jgi:hypothetical protein
LHEIVAPTAIDVDWGDQSGILAWQDAVGIVTTQMGCTEAEERSPDETIVECPWVYDSRWHQALGLEPSSMTQGFVIRDGKIQDEYETNAEAPDVTRVWGEFRQWVGTNHGADIATMYDESGGPRLSPESIALWERYTEEFVTEMGN